MIDTIIDDLEKKIVSLDSNPSWVCRQNTGQNWVIPVPDGRKEWTRAPEECRKGMGPPAAVNKPAPIPGSSRHRGIFRGFVS